jgi:hypothetical protein
MEATTTPTKCQYAGCKNPATFILSNPHNGELACCLSCAPGWAKDGKANKGVYTVRRITS